MARRSKTIPKEEPKKKTAQEHYIGEQGVKRKRELDIFGRDERERKPRPNQARQPEAYRRQAQGHRAARCRLPTGVKEAAAKAGRPPEGKREADVHGCQGGGDSSGARSQSEAPARSQRAVWCTTSTPAAAAAQGRTHQEEEEEVRPRTTTRDESYLFSKAHGPRRFRYRRLARGAGSPSSCRPPRATRTNAGS